MRPNRRVVITGIGVCTSLGMGVQQFWSGLLNGSSGISPTPGDYFVPSRVAGQISTSQYETKQKETENCLKNNLNLDFVHEWRSISRASSLGIFAANEALIQSGWDSKLSNRAGIYFGAGMEGIDELMRTSPGIHAKKYSAVGPYSLTRSLANMPAGVISQIWAVRGPCMATNTACATGLHCIGEGYRMIQYGEADLVIAGGCEAPINQWAMASFSRIRALATKFNDKPEEASRPFDLLRDGFVMSEGSAAVVLQVWPPPAYFADLGINAPGRPIAEILGFGRSGDAHHLVAPDPTGDGAYRCMVAALQDAGLDSTDQIGHINCHATSTPMGDKIELAAIAKFLGTYSKTNTNNPVLINSIKGHTGHCLGAAGALETAYTAMAIQHGRVVGTLNLHNPVSLSDLDEVLSNQDSSIKSVRACLDAYESRAKLLLHSDKHKAWPNPDTDCPKRSRRIALTNSFGFGGTNGTLILADWCDG